MGPRERQINALAEAGGHLYVGTEAGLLDLIAADGCEDGSLAVKRILEAPVHDLSINTDGMVAIASSKGLFVIAGPGADVVPLGAQGEHPKLFAVAWSGTTIYAGGMDGLYRTDGDHLTPIGRAHGWVTALLEDGPRMLVGTYGDGVYTLEGDTTKPVKGLEDQWVPTHAIRRIGRSILIGGLGMAAVRLDAGAKPQAVPVPVRDVNDIVEGGNGRLLFLTTDGIAEVGGWIERASTAFYSP
jgi:hypothetical protein